jgi:hypothetical protein
MKKKINIIIMLLIVASTAFSQKQFVIKGTLAKEKNGLIRLTYSSLGKTYKDSVRFTGGVFEFKGTIEAPVEASIIINPLYGRIDRDQYYSQDKRDFYLEFGQNLIKSDSGLKAALIKSGQEQINFEQVQKNDELIGNQMFELNTLGQRYMTQNNKSGMDSLRKVAQGIMEYADDLDSNFILAHPKSYVAFRKLTLAELSEKMTYKDFTAAYNTFSKNIRESYQGKKLGERLRVRGKLLVGNPAPEISLPGPDGKPLQMSALKGKNVLLCFLQSPGNKVLMNAYPQLSASNVQVYAVTFSDDPLGWKSAVAAEASEWINVRDDNAGEPSYRGMLSEVSKSYNLSPSSVNQCILLDARGHILSGMMNIDPTLIEKVKKIIP